MCKVGEDVDEKKLKTSKVQILGFFKFGKKLEKSRF